MELVESSAESGEQRRDLGDASKVEREFRVPHERIGSVGPRSEGYRDQPASEFRRLHPEKYIDGKDWSPERSQPEFSDPGKIAAGINPNHGDPSGSYDMNCADCARCYEQTWRGRTEVAAGRAPEYGPYGLEVTGEDSELTEEWAGEKFRVDTNADDLRKALEEGGHGSSAIVHTEFDDVNGMPGGHAYNVVNYQGTLVVGDGQRSENGRWDPDTIHRH